MLSIDPLEDDTFTIRPQQWDIVWRSKLLYLQIDLQMPNYYMSFSLSIEKTLAIFILILAEVPSGNSMHNHHHHHHVVLPARIFLTLSRYFSLSFIASGRSSGQHPISSQSCCTYVRAGCPAFARPYVGVHWSTSLMSSSLLLQQCPACLVCLTWIVFVMGCRWPYSWCFMGYCLQDLFNIACSILV